jgi:large subunit ribosomal protein L4e
MRGRKYKGRKSLLIVAASDQGLGKAARNLPGVDFITVEKLNAELLAPGTRAGRLTVWTESSLQKLSEKSSKEMK